MTIRKERPRLSICIATFNRGKFIGATLDSILDQLEGDVELVVVDGASGDDTPEVMAQYSSRCPAVRYHREQVNSGVDSDFDKAVGYASGEYCWLMPDDDLLAPGAISRVLSTIGGTVELVVLNAEVWNADFSRDLKTRMLAFPEDKNYGMGDGERVLMELGTRLSYIGGIVIKRNLWLERDRTSYYGSLFIHVGVIFQHPPIERVTVIADPLIKIRYGNGMWTPRSFEIWKFKWPQLIWSFTDFSDKAKQAVTLRDPWRRFSALFKSRAMGDYSVEEFRKFVAQRANGIDLALAYTVSVFPAKLANFLLLLYFAVLRTSANYALFDLLRSRHSTTLGRLLASALGVKVL